jgi:hypothetical protein
MPISNLYFWLVVRSLKRRLDMEQAIGYNENRVQVLSHTQALFFDECGSFILIA